MSITRTVLTAAVIFAVLFALEATSYMKNGSRLKRGLTAGAAIFVVLLLLNVVLSS